MMKLIQIELIQVNTFTYYIRFDIIYIILETVTFGLLYLFITILNRF
jgi:hypothetical protein